MQSVFRQSYQNIENHVNAQCESGHSQSCAADLLGYILSSHREAYRRYCNMPGQTETIFSIA